MAALSRAAVAVEAPASIAARWWSPFLQSLNPPSAVTLVGVLAGGAGLLAVVAGQALWVTVAVAVALITDRIDGPIARKFGWQSEMGAQLDSLSDALACVIVPSLALVRFFPGALALVAAALYLVAGVGRLAAFHVVGMQVVRGRECFFGVPTPAAAAGLLCALAIGARVGSPVAVGAAVVLAALMISALPYPKKGVNDVFCIGAIGVGLAVHLRLI